MISNRRSNDKGCGRGGGPRPAGGRVGVLLHSLPWPRCGSACPGGGAPRGAETSTRPAQRRELEYIGQTFPTVELNGSFPLTLLAQHDVGLVVSDGGESWPVFEDVTARLVYVRLRGATELYASGYDEPALRSWAAKVRAWHEAGHDVVVDFDNDAKVRAPFDALALTELLADVAERPAATVGTLGR